MSGDLLDTVCGINQHNRYGETIILFWGKIEYREFYNFIVHTCVGI